MNVSSFYRNKPKIWRTFNALFAKGIDMTRYVVVRQKYVYTPKISGQAKTFQRAMLAQLQGNSPSAGGTPCHFFLCVAKYACMFLSVTVLLSALRDSLSPVCRVFSFFI